MASIRISMQDSLDTRNSRGSDRRSRETSTSASAYHPQDTLSANNARSSTSRGSTELYYQRSSPTLNTPTPVHDFDDTDQDYVRDGGVVINVHEPEDGPQESSDAGMRYTAVTCDPDDFQERGYKLRQAKPGKPTELLIAVTSYNEEGKLYARTLSGVMDNVREICAKRRWKGDMRNGGEDGHAPRTWENITVAVIIDGMGVVDQAALDILARLGVYKDPAELRSGGGAPVVAHLFEHTTQLSVDDKTCGAKPLNEDDSESQIAVQMILVIKAQNQKKINSHRWLFNAISKSLKPEVCVLLDVGTKPGPKSIYYLWRAFNEDKHVGGCCGEIRPMIGKYRGKLLNPLVAAQNFEYKMSNILDKPFESSIGYVSVLPGAFSAYRYKAIEGQPLRQYFYGDHTARRQGWEKMSIFKQNMFLAEDRILCFEVVTNSQNGGPWKLSYVKRSKAETDVPDGVGELVGQRRRWLNGSFAASVYSIAHCHQLNRSKHNVLRKFAFYVQIFYNICSLAFFWFALANLFLTFSIIIDLLPDQDVFLFGSEKTTSRVNLALKWVYFVFLALQFILALGNRPKAERVMYTVTICVFGILAIYLTVCSIWLLALIFMDGPRRLTSLSDDGGSGSYFVTPIGVIIIAVFSTSGIYAIAPILYGDPWHLITCSIQYLAMAPSFTNVLNVYAFCNLHDVSWGTKGSDKAEEHPPRAEEKRQSASSGGSSAALPRLDERMASGSSPVPSGAETAQSATCPDAPSQRASEQSEPAKKKKAKTDERTQDDKNRTFRTRLLVLWMLSNAGLGVGILNLNGLGTGDPRQDARLLSRKQSIYLAVILYFTFSLTTLRFAGCLWYLVRHDLLERMRRRK